MSIFGKIMGAIFGNKAGATPAGGAAAGGGGGAAAAPSAAPGWIALQELTLSRQALPMRSPVPV